MGLLVGDVLRHAAAVTPHGLAATLDDDEVTFAQLETVANRVAHALRGLGLEHRERVAWWGETSLEALPVFFALAKLGAVFMPLDARLGVAEAEPVIRQARPDLLVVDQAHAERAEDLGVEVARLTHDELGEQATRARADEVVAREVSERDVHVVFFTSGSTGRPKGVVLSHRVNCLRSFPPLAAEPGGGTVCMFPLFHMAGWSIALGCWQARRPVHFVTQPDGSAVLEAAARRHASRIYAVPAVWTRILEHGVDGVDLGALREADTGTSATPPELVAAIRDALPHTVTRVFYGSTEAGPATVLPHRDVARKPGSVGLPQPGVALQLAPDGEVCVRSEFLMDGYLDDPDATGEVLRDGWYHTGDLGVLDDEGYLSIVGRCRDVIRTGGETVAPVEVERVVADHADVAEVAVVGVPDPQWGEIVCAVIVPRGEAEAALTVEVVRAHCEGRLAPFKVPRRVETVAALPRTAATGQVQRALLVEQLATQPRRARS